MNEFASRGAPLEYWFWKVNKERLAFLVDFIIRRRTGRAEVRVSLWVEGRGRVERISSDSWSADSANVRIGACGLEPLRSAGEVADVAWDLTWQRGNDLIDTRPPLLGHLHALDLELVGWPTARISGTVTVAGESFILDDDPAAIFHYWGRRLPDRWCWISATGFQDEPDRRLEALVSTSRLWGRGRMPLGGGYLWLTDGQRSEFTLSPVNGLIRGHRDGDSMTISQIRLSGPRHTLLVSAPTEAFNDLGEGIRQTLLADLRLDEKQVAQGRVGLEFRRS